jgi:hypothetical protein
MMPIGLLAQAEEGRELLLPDAVGEGIIWGVLVLVLVGLWWVVRRTRRRAEDEFWERKRREADGDDGPPTT